MKGKSVIVLLILLGCIDPYTPPSTVEDFGYLVVDGVLNTGGDTKLPWNSKISHDSRECADCRNHGGVTKVPAFW